MKQQGAELSQRSRHVWRAIGSSRPLVTKTKTNVQPKGPRSRHVWRAIERSRPLLTKTKRKQCPAEGTVSGTKTKQTLKREVEYRTQNELQDQRRRKQM